MKFINLFILFTLVFSKTLADKRNSIQEKSKKALRTLGISTHKEDFPFSGYKVHFVNGLGNFFIDDIPDGIKEHLKKGIYWESGIGEYVRKYAEHNSVVIDIGAHIGIHTVTMSRKVGPNGLVVAFEPQRKIVSELYWNLKINKCLKNVAIFPYAVGETDQLVQLNVRNIFNEGGTSIGSGGDLTRMIRLDDLNLENVSFIKMDVERYELNVLKGARETMARNRPVMVLEILAGEDPFDCSPESKIIWNEITEYFESLDYRLDLIFGNDFIASPKEMNL